MIKLKDIFNTVNTKEEKKSNKFYNFSFNEASNSTDFYLYGEIISGGNDWKWDDTDVTFQDVRDTLDYMSDNSTLNIFINSPGGSVFTTQGIISMLERAKDRGITINSYIDGLGASCASWLPMIADNLYIYSGSILMIHKPMSSCWGANANDMREQIEILDKIENDVIIPLYMSRAKEGVTEDMIKDYMANETWFTSKEILDVFDNITLLETSKKITACVDRDAMKNYVNMPDNIKTLLNEKEDKDLEDNKETIIDNEEVIVTNEEESKEEKVEDETPVENEEVVEDGEEKEEESKEEDESKEEETENSTDVDAQAKLDESNEKVLALNDKVQELTALVNSLQPIVDEYNAKKEAELKSENEAKIEATMNLYKNKFEKIGALDKFNEKEVQDLIANSIVDATNLSKLNSMLVDLINVEEPSKIVKLGTSETGTEVKDLIPTEDGGLSSLFE